MLLDLDEQSKSLKSTQCANNCGTYNLACEYYCKYVDVQALLFSKFMHVKNQVYKWNMQKIWYQLFGFEGHNPSYTW